MNSSDSESMTGPFAMETRCRISFGLPGSFDQSTSAMHGP
jgi:hypothetical protein